MYLLNYLLNTFKIAIHSNFQSVLHHSYCPLHVHVDQKNEARKYLLCSLFLICLFWLHHSIISAVIATVFGEIAIPFARSLYYTLSVVLTVSCEHLSLIESFLCSCMH